MRNVTRNEKNVRMRAYGEVLSVHTPSRSRHLPMSRREICSKKLQAGDVQDCKRI